MSTKDIRAGTTITKSDVELTNITVIGSHRAIEETLGLVSKRNISKGNVIFLSDLDQPPLIKKNQKITLIYQNNTITISTEGRALEAGKVGETIKALNSNSRTEVNGKISSDGSILINP